MVLMYDLFILSMRYIRTNQSSFMTKELSIAIMKKSNLRKRLLKEKREAFTELKPRKVELRKA